MRLHLVVSPDLTKLEDAPAPGVDAIWLDGDAQSAARAIRGIAHHKTRPQCYVRLADLGPEVEKALDTLMPAKPDGLILPLECGADLQHLGAKLALREAEHGLEDGGTRIIAMIAAPGPILRLSTVPASRRLSALAFDSCTFAASVGSDDIDAGPVALARHMVVLAARALGVSALLTGIGFGEIDVLAETAQRDGFDGIVTRVQSAAKNMFRVRNSSAE